MTNKTQGCSEEKKSGRGGTQEKFFQIERYIYNIFKSKGVRLQIFHKRGTPYPVNATSLTRGVALPLPSV